MEVTVRCLNTKVDLSTKIVGFVLKQYKKNENFYRTERYFYLFIYEFVESNDTACKTVLYIKILTL